MMKTLLRHKLLTLMLVLVIPVLLMVVSPGFLQWAMQNQAPLAWIVGLLITLGLFLCGVALVLFVYLLTGLIPIWRVRYTLHAIELILPLFILNGLPPSLSFVLRTQYGGLRTLVEIIVIFLSALGCGFLWMVVSGKPLESRRAQKDEAQP